MALYSFSAKVVSRSNNHHATAAAAYRSGSEIYDERTNKNHDYTPKTGVLHSEILTPETAPAWMHDREQLWNAVERQEKRADAQLARDIMCALPHELSFAQQLDLVCGFSQKEFVARGMIADLSIHAPSRDEGADQRNTHAHIMLSMRPIDGEGFAKTKARDWNDKALLEHWREAWAEHCNVALEAAGFDARIDHRSLELQGVDRVPTEHMGKAATAYERDGILTERGDRNREAGASNDRLDQLVAELAAVDAKIAALEERRLDAAYGTATPDITITEGIDRELSARFDDWQPVIQGVAPQTAEPVKAEAVDAPPPEFGEPVVVSEEHSAWRRFADRARAFAHQMEALWQDESSGAPQAQPEPEAPGKWTRLVHATGRIFKGWGHRDLHDLAEGISEAAQVVAGDDAATPAGWTERHAKDAAQRMGDVLRDERGSVPATEPAASPETAIPPDPHKKRSSSAFDRLMAQATEPQATPPKPMSAFDRLAAEYFASISGGEAEPEADGPQPSHGSQPSRGPQAHEPEPDEPEPWHGPDIDID